MAQLRFRAAHTRDYEVWVTVDDVTTVVERVELTVSKGRKNEALLTVKVEGKADVELKTKLKETKAHDPVGALYGDGRRGKIKGNFQLKTSG